MMKPMITPDILKEKKEQVESSIFRVRQQIVQLEKHHAALQGQAQLLTELIDEVGSLSAPTEVQGDN